MTIKANKHAADDKAVKDFEIEYLKDVFPSDRLACKETLKRYHKYFSAMAILDNVMAELDNDLITGNTTTSFKEAWDTGKTFVLNEMDAGSVFDLDVKFGI